MADQPWLNDAVVQDNASANDKPWMRDQEVNAAPQSTMQDVGQSALAGIRSGIESTAGMMGDMGETNASVASWLASKLGAGEDTQNIVGSIARRISPFPTMPSTDEIRTQATDPTLGEGYKPKTVAGEYARTVGEFAPGIVGGKGSLAKRALTQVVAPAVMSENAGQLAKGTGYEPYARVAGAIAGGVLPSAVSKVFSPAVIDAERQKAAAILKKEGVDLTAGQITGNDKLRYMESELGGRVGQEFADKQKSQFTASVLKRAGITADRATPEVIDKGFTDIGKKFDIAKQYTIKGDSKLIPGVQKVAKDYANKTAESNRVPYVTNIANDIQEKVKAGGIDGNWYLNTVSEIRAAAQSASDQPTREALYDLRGALDNAMMRSISKSRKPSKKDDLAAFMKARREYKNMLVIEKAATSAGANSDLGYISPASLRSATVQQGRRAYARGKGDLAEISRAGNSLMKDMPNSGTPGRQAAQRIVNLPGAALGLSAGIQTGSLLGTAGATALGALAPWATGRAILSGPGRAYLTRQAENPVTLQDLLQRGSVSGLLAQSPDNRR